MAASSDDAIGTVGSLVVTDCQDSLGLEEFRKVFQWLVPSGPAAGKISYSKTYDRGL